MRVSVLVAVAAFLLPSVTQPSSGDDKAVRLARAMAAQLLESAHLPGLSVAISRNGRVVFAGGFGYADVERKERVTPNTRFRLASVSKIVTATALGKLVQDRRLDLDVPIQDYVPSFPLKRWPITPRALAGHLSGIPHYSDDDKRAYRFYGSVLDALGVFAHQSLRAEPNTEYRYSTHGYTLLSAVVEGAARQPFLTYIQEAIFAPLGMRSTGPDLRPRPSIELTTFYQLIDGQLSKIEKPEDPSYKWAGGGLTSTPTDLLRLASAYFNGFLEPEIIAMMWRSQRLTFGRETGVGLGWRTSMDVGGRTVIEHAGSMEGTRTVLSMFPSQQLVVALMTNREWSSTIEETAHVLALPFLVPASSQSRLRGKSEGTLEVVAVSGQKTAQMAELTLRDGRGQLKARAGDGQQSSFLFDLGADDVYALVRPDGIYYSTLTVADGLVSLRALGYGSPQLTSPAGNPAFMTFKGRFSRE